MEEDVCLHSGGMPANQVSYADLGTGLYAEILIKFLWNKLDCVERYLHAGDQNKAYYGLIPELEPQQD